MCNSVPVGFLGHVDLEQHTTKVEKPYEQWKYTNHPCILLKINTFQDQVAIVCLTTVVKTDLTS